MQIIGSQLYNANIERRVRKPTTTTSINYYNENKILALL